MTSEVRKRLKGMGFEEQNETPAAYQPTTRWTHHTVSASSLFLGEGSKVKYIETTDLPGGGPFIIANGRSLKKGMTQKLQDLGVEPTGRIRRPKKPATNDDDPYWQDQDLKDLLKNMEKKWPPGQRRA